MADTGGGAAAGVVMFVAAGIIAIVMASMAKSEGAPGGFVSAGILMGVGMIIAAVIIAFNAIRTSGLEEQNAALAGQEAARMRQEEQDRLKEQVADAVRDTLKTTIMVRCRYCGSLNQESAAKCESCGANL